MFLILEYVVFFFFEDVPAANVVTFWKLWIYSIMQKLYLLMSLWAQLSWKYWKRLFTQPSKLNLPALLKITNRFFKLTNNVNILKIMPETIESLHCFVSCLTRFVVLLNGRYRDGLKLAVHLLLFTHFGDSERLLSTCNGCGERFHLRLGNRV